MSRVQRAGGVLVLTLFFGMRTQAAPTRPLALVDATRLVPDLVVEMRYATAENFLRRAVYPKDARCLLRPEAARHLAEAAEALRAQGFRLKVFDCYRPLSVQREMWERFPHRGYVANPEHGSHHNRGTAVDLTLVRLDGQPVEMPTDFDAFTQAAHHSYAAGSPAARAHRDLLRKAMEAAGFRPIRMEWWHYALVSSAQYPVLDLPLR